MRLGRWYVMPLRWYIDRALARIVVHELRTQFGKRCDVFDLDDIPEKWKSDFEGKPRTWGRCGICEAHEAADLVEDMYR